MSTGLVVGPSLPTQPPSPDDVPASELHKAGQIDTADILLASLLGGIVGLVLIFGVLYCMIKRPCRRQHTPYSQAEDFVSYSPGFLRPVPGSPRKAPKVPEGTPPYETKDPNQHRFPVAAPKKALRAPRHMYTPGHWAYGEAGEFPPVYTYKQSPERRRKQSKRSRHLTPSPEYLDDKKVSLPYQHYTDYSSESASSSHSRTSKSSAERQPAGAPAPSKEPLASIALKLPPPRLQLGRLGSPFAPSTEMEAAVERTKQPPTLHQVFAKTPTQHTRQYSQSDGVVFPERHPDHKKSASKSSNCSAGFGNSGAEGTPSPPPPPPPYGREGHGLYVADTDLQPPQPAAAPNWPRDDMSELSSVYMEYRPSMFLAAPEG